MKLKQLLATIIIKIKNILLSKFSYVLLIYLFCYLIVVNFISMYINPSNLEGVVNFEVMILKNFNITSLIQQLVFIVIVFCSLRGKKWALDWLSAILILDVIGNLMIIETSNFSMYNIILIIDIIMSILVFYCIYNRGEKLDNRST
ncbi:hypothetical protein [Romboutsia sp.]|uniref:hypothetical protein n=1 Tax=Romboutsia sp. TaxID=1965302 RepID=UPI003F2C42A7